MSNQKLAQIKTAGFILKPNDPEIKTLYERIKSQFEAKGISVMLAENSAKRIGLKGIPFKDISIIPNNLQSTIEDWAQIFNNKICTQPSNTEYLPAYNKYNNDSKKYSQKLENFSKRFLSII